MQEGNHGVRTAWGFLAVRLPMPEDKQWAADRATILQGLGVLDPQGNPTDRLAVVKAADIVRTTQEDWQKERDKMVKTCNQCHSVNFAKAELEKDDQMIREADRLMAEGIRIVADLYQDGILKKPMKYIHSQAELSIQTQGERTSPLRSSTNHDQTVHWLSSQSVILIGSLQYFF